jgi:predicted Zn-dependent protease
VGRNEQYGVAIAQALTGDSVRAQAGADELGKMFPEDTVVRYNYLPTLNAQIALTQKDPSKAIETLQNAAPYELGGVGNLSLYPIYLRGEAYLASHQGSQAAAEFQKILDHRGIVVDLPIGALAHLQIARAYAMQGDTAKAKAAYQDFLTLWKDATLTFRFSSLRKRSSRSFNSPELSGTFAGDVMASAHFGGYGVNRDLAA